MIIVIILYQLSMIFDPLLFIKKLLGFRRNRTNLYSLSLLKLSFLYNLRVGTIAKKPLHTHKNLQISSRILSMREVSNQFALEYQKRRKYHF